MSESELTTGRLVLRRFVEADAAACAAIRFHPEVETWLMPATSDDTVAEMRQRIAEYDASFEQHGYGVWAVTERLSGNLVGYCGLRRVPEVQATDVVWTIAPAAQGKGYAREAAAAAVAAGFAGGLEVIGALIRPDNVRSQAVARSLGMALQRTIEYRPGRLRGWWEIGRAAFVALQR
jgi:RimJ/RimL family protein N-acetyltransferase